MKDYKIALIKLNNMEEQNIYFNPGDVVQLKQNIPNKPTMIVVKKETSIFKHYKDKIKKPILIGIRCRWFTSYGELQEAVFNTKDLNLL